MTLHFNVCLCLVIYNILPWLSSKLDVFRGDDMRRTYRNYDLVKWRLCNKATHFEPTKCSLETNSFISIERVVQKFCLCVTQTISSDTKDFKRSSHQILLREKKALTSIAPKDTSRTLCAFQYFKRLHCVLFLYKCVNYFPVLIVASS